jgi:hypothetical protein
VASLEGRIMAEASLDEPLGGSMRFARVHSPAVIDLVVAHAVAPGIGVSLGGLGKGSGAAEGQV